MVQDTQALCLAIRRGGWFWLYNDLTSLSRKALFKHLRFNYRAVFVRVVVDSNRAQSAELFAFLASSKTNRAVVTDWLMMEAYKGRTLDGLYKTLGVLKLFPNQVIVTKNTGMCMKTSVGNQMSKRLIWNEITDGFPNFIEEVEAAKRGNSLLEASLLSRSQEANQRMSDLLDQVDWIIGSYETMFKTLTQQDVRAIRGNGLASPDVIQRIALIGSSIAEGYRRNLDIKSLATTGRDFGNDFLFRVGMAITSSFLEWVRTGNQRLAKPEKVRNDHVDAMLSVYGTYFNGLMTMDSKLIQLHSLNRQLLKKMRASMPPAYYSSNFWGAGTRC